MVINFNKYVKFIFLDIRLTFYPIRVWQNLNEIYSVFYSLYQPPINFNDNLVAYQKENNFELYDNTKKEVMTDEQYDLLLDSYNSKFPNTPFSKSLEDGSGHSTLLVSEHKKVDLPVHMGSMTKGKPGTGDVLKFETKYKKG